MMKRVCVWLITQNGPSDTKLKKKKKKKPRLRYCCLPGWLIIYIGLLYDQPRTACTTHWHLLSSQPKPQRDDKLFKDKMAGVSVRVFGYIRPFYILLRVVYISFNGRPRKYMQRSTNLHTDLSLCV